MYNIIMELIKGDLKRFGNNNFYFTFNSQPCFRYMVLLRMNKEFSRYNPFVFILRIWLKKLQTKYGIQIPIHTNIKKGFLMNHYGGIVVNQSVVIGENCNVSQGVTIGNISRGKLQGCPTIGDRVWIGANSVVVGKITIGNDVLIAPLSYINFDIPDNAVVSGNPARIINYNGSGSYIKNIS